MLFNIGDILRRKKEFSNGKEVLALYEGDSVLGLKCTLLQEYNGCSKGSTFYGNPKYWELYETLSQQEMICRKIKSMYAKRKELGYRF